MKDESKTHLSYWVITLLALIFCSVVGARNRSLVEQLKEIPQSGGVSGPHEAIPGDLLPGFEAQGPDGVSVPISYRKPFFAPDDSMSAGRAEIPHRLLMIHSPSCGVCRTQAELWEGLFRDLRDLAPELEIAAMLLNGEVEDEPLIAGLPSIPFPDYSFQRAYRVTAIPLTLLVSPEGRLLWSHYGLLESPKVDDLIQRIQHELDKTPAILNS